MDFTFSELDESLRDGVRAVLEARCSPATIRAAWNAEPGATDRGAWDALAEVGVLDALVPEDQGGVGLDERSVVLVFQAAGYSGLPDPLIETAAFAARLLGPHYAGSRTMVTTNVGSGPEGDLAPWAADADLLLLMAPDGAIHVRPPEAVTLIPAEAVDRSRRLWRVQWEPGPAELDAAATDVARAVDRATLAAAAELVGLGERMLDMTVGYVSQREQFGTRIGAFQAIKHRLAD
ncbi:MAG TPA: acyl-CoA dehydrogenase family protein, partial [Acidimicrobiales bacterium]|nr:acyl-CoA dehydrogenase family protein [Acidimicrobiales bacterium]